MKNLLLVGIVLMAVGAALLVFDTFKTREKHEASILGADLSVTTTERKKIPSFVGGTVLAVGAAVTVIAAVKRGKS